MKRKYPLISVVILNYNGLKFLKETIPPLLELSYPNYELIVVDNGSNDGSVKYLNRFNKIKVIENTKNLGYSKGKNIGVRSAKGEYVLLLDNDILIKNKNILEKLLKEFTKHKNNKIMFSILTIDRGKRKTTYYCNTTFNSFLSNKAIPIHRVVNYKNLIKMSYPYGRAIFFKKSWFIKIGGYDESQPFYIDDYDIGLRTWLFGGKVYLYNRDYFEHIGVDEFHDELWCWKYKYYFSGISRTIFKNYKWKNIIVLYPIILALFPLKVMKQIIRRRDICVLKSFLWSVHFFIKKFPDTLKAIPLFFILLAGSSTIILE